MGFEVWIDPTIKLGHMGVHEFEGSFGEEFLYPLLRPVDSKKEVEDAKKAAKQAIVLADLEQKRVKQNRALELRQKQNEAYLRQMQKQEMEKNKAKDIAGKFTHGRNPVRANTRFSMKGSMKGSMRGRR
jgi:hypothetical protein